MLPPKLSCLPPAGYKARGRCASAVTQAPNSATRNGACPEGVTRRCATATPAVLPPPARCRARVRCPSAVTKSPERSATQPRSCASSGSAGHSLQQGAEMLGVAAPEPKASDRSQSGRWTGLPAACLPPKWGLQDTRTQQCGGRRARGVPNPVPAPGRLWPVHKRKMQSAHRAAASNMWSARGRLFRRAYSVPKPARGAAKPGNRRAAVRYAAIACGFRCQEMIGSSKPPDLGTRRAIAQHAANACGCRCDQSFESWKPLPDRRCCRVQAHRMRLAASSCSCGGVGTLCVEIEQHCRCIVHEPWDARTRAACGTAAAGGGYIGGVNIVMFSQIAHFAGGEAMLLELTLRRKGIMTASDSPS